MRSNQWGGRRNDQLLYVQGLKLNSWHCSSIPGGEALNWFVLPCQNYIFFKILSILQFRSLLYHFLSLLTDFGHQSVDLGLIVSDHRLSHHPCIRLSHGRRVSWDEKQQLRLWRFPISVSCWVSKALLLFTQSRVSLRASHWWFPLHYGRTPYHHLLLPSFQWKRHSLINYCCPH